MRQSAVFAGALAGHYYNCKIQCVIYHFLHNNFETCNLMSKRFNNWVSYYSGLNVVLNHLLVSLQKF